MTIPTERLKEQGKRFLGILPAAVITAVIVRFDLLKWMGEGHRHVDVSLSDATPIGIASTVAMAGLVLFVVIAASKYAPKV